MKMNKYTILVLVCVLVLGCKKPFSKSSETALASPFSKAKVQESIVFIAGFDEGDNTYYTNAKRYFTKIEMQVVADLFSIDEIINFINRAEENHIRFKEIHIVSHSNAWLGVSLKTTKSGERITVKTLRNATRAKKYVGSKTSICINIL